MQLVFDRHTGLLQSISNTAENIKVQSKLAFGGYNSMDFKSGAYLLMLDQGSEQQVGITYDFKLRENHYLEIKIKSPLCVAFL